MVYSARQTLLLLLFRTLVSSVPNATIYGPPYFHSFFQELKESFALSYSYNMSYVPVSQNTNNETNIHLNAGDPVLVNTLNNLTTTSIVIPIFGFSIAVVHSVPVFVLNLSQSVLVDIWTGKIRYWNHSDVAALNPDETLPSGPISIFAGSLMNRVIEGMSVFANRTITLEEVMNQTTFAYVAEDVCSNVRNTPNSIGFTWLAAALAENSQVARLMNKDGTLVAPTLGVESAMFEYFAAQKNAPPGTVVTPYNMPGQFSWPLISLLYLVLPPNFHDCEKLTVIQTFVSFIMFQTANMDLLAQALGWEPIKSDIVGDHVLGRVTATVDYQDKLFSLDCGNKKIINFHTLGTSSQLSLPILKALAPYTGKEYANIRMLSAVAGIKPYLGAMVQAHESTDMSFTWLPLAKEFPQLHSVPVYMGGLVVFANVPDLKITLDQLTVADIFGRRITNWNHSRIQNLNPGANLPNKTILVLAAADNTIDDSASAMFSKWLQNASSLFNWSQTKSVQLTPQETDIRRYVNYFAYSIGYGFTHTVTNASQNIARLIGHDGQPITFSADALTACWAGLNDPKCWPLATPLAMVLRPPTDCAHQRRSVQFVDWLLNRVSSVHPFLLTDPDLVTKDNMGGAEFCNGRSLLRTIPEPQGRNSSVTSAIQVFCGIGIFLAIIQAIALGVSRKRSELKSASVLFSLLAVIGVFLILLAPLMIVQNKISTLACGTSAWFLCVGYTLCYGSLFAKLFRLYMIFTSRKLVVPRLSNKKLMWMVGAFLVVDLVLLVIYTILTPAEPYTFSTMVRSDEDHVTGYRELTLEMCAFNVRSPVLHLIFIFKCIVAVGGAVMAFFIRQVDRRFTSVSALGWCFYNMFLTVIIAIIISIQFTSESNLETPMIVPIFCGLWIMYATLCALALDSNVLLACKDFSRPLRKLLNSGKLSKDSRDAATGTGSKNSGEKDDPDSATKQSQSSTIFVVNREMFPSKYDEFSAELLDQILQELNHQRAAVRRVIAAGVPSGATLPDTTTVELSPLGDNWRRSSTRVDSPAARLNSKSRVGLAPLSVDTSPVNSSMAGTPRGIATADVPPEDRPDTSSVSSFSIGDSKGESVAVCIESKPEPVGAANPESIGDAM